MFIVTTDFIPNMKIVEMKDCVFSEQVLSINAVKDVMNSFKGIFGGELGSYAEEYKKARLLALKHIEKQAEKIGGNAIINLNVRYNQFINSDIIFIVVAASGLVVTVEEAENRTEC